MNQYKTVFNKMLHGLLAVVMTFTSFTGYAQTTLPTSVQDNPNLPQSAKDAYDDLVENGVATKAVALFPDRPECERTLFKHEEPVSEGSFLSTHDVGTMLTGVFGGSEDNAALAFYKPESYIPRTQFTSCDPRLSDNKWVAALFGSGEKVMKGQSMADLIEGAPAANQIAHNRNTTYGRDQERHAYQVMAQDYVNMAFLYGPTLKSLIEQEKYDEAFRYAFEKRAMRLIILSTGIQVMGVPEFTEAQMHKFYAAGAITHSKFSRHALTGIPYAPREWETASGYQRKADRNINSVKESEDGLMYPNYAWFHSKSPDGPGLFETVLKLAAGVIVGIATAGIGSAIAQGVVSSVGTGSIAAGTATIGGISVASGTVGGTVLSVASNAVAGAAIGAAQGQDFGDALKSGLVGGAVGSVVGAGAGQLGINDAVAGAVGNQAVADFVTATAVGTVTNAALNGGDLDSAFQAAATGAALGQLQNRLMTPSGPSEAQIAFEQGQARNNALVQDGSTQVAQEIFAERFGADWANQTETIVNGSNTAGGGINFSIAAQNTTIWNNVNTVFNNQMDNRVRDLASGPVQGVVPSEASLGGDDIDAGFVSNDTYVDPFAGVQETIDYANQVLFEGALLNPATVGGVLGPGGTLALGSNALDGYFRRDLMDMPNIGFHGSKHDDLTDILTPRTLGGSRTFGDTFDYALNNPGPLLDGSTPLGTFDQGFIDRVNWEADRIAFFDDLDTALGAYYGVGNGRNTYIIDTSGSNVLGAADRPTSINILEGGNDSLERFALGNHQVIGSVDRYGNLNFNDTDVGTRIGGIYDYNNNATDFNFSLGRATGLATGVGLVAEGVFAVDSLLNFVGSNTTQADLINLNNNATAAQNYADTFSDAGSILNGSREAANASIMVAGTTQLAVDYAGARAGVVADISNSAVGQAYSSTVDTIANSAIGQAASTVLEPIGAGLSYVGDLASSGFSSFNDWLNDYGARHCVDPSNCSYNNDGD